MNITQQIQEKIQNEPTLRIGDFSDSIKIGGKKYIYWNNSKTIEINEKEQTIKRIANTNQWIRELDFLKNMDGMKN